MRTKMMSLFRRAIEDQDGQSMIMVVMAMFALFGMAGLTLDIGHAYFVRSQLQNRVNAAGLAAAQYIYNKTSSDVPDGVTAAINFLGNNPIPGIASGAVQEVTGYPKETLVCRTSLIVDKKDFDCSNSPNNALVVTDSVRIPTTFMSVFNIKSLTVTATATASMQGSRLYNIAVIEDLTGSVADVDSNCASMSSFQCTLNGLQQFLAEENPCPPGTAWAAGTCTNNNAMIHVALFGFPNMNVTSLPTVNACTGATPASAFTVYTLPVAGAASYTPLTYQYTYNGTVHYFTSSYEMTYGAADADANGFVSDYWDGTNATTGKLNPASSLVKAIGYSGTSTKTGCLSSVPDNTAVNGAVTPPAAGGGIDTGSGVVVNTTDVGEGLTYLASVIYAAQSALTAEQARMLALGYKTTNVMILQSDGAMNTQWIYFPQGLVTQAPPATVASEPSTGKYLGNFAGYNLSTPATVATGSVCGTNGVNGTSTCPAGVAGIGTKTQPNLTALIAKNLGSAGPSGEATGAISGLYPDFLDECQQTVIAAQKATNAGTLVFSIAYDASTTTGGASTSACGSGSNPAHYTDVTQLSAANYPLALNVSWGSSIGALTPCIEMADAASSLDNFYSYYESGTTGGCVDSVHLTSTSLASIYSSIAASIGSPILIPNNAP